MHYNFVGPLLAVVLFIQSLGQAFASDQLCYQSLRRISARNQINKISDFNPKRYWLEIANYQKNLDEALAVDFTPEELALLKRRNGFKLFWDILRRPKKLNELDETSKATLAMLPKAKKIAKAYAGINDFLDYLINSPIDKIMKLMSGPKAYSSFIRPENRNFIKGLLNSNYLIMRELMETLSPMPGVRVKTLWNRFTPDNWKKIPRKKVDIFMDQFWHKTKVLTNEEKNLLGEELVEVYERRQKFILQNKNLHTTKQVLISLKNGLYAVSLYNAVSYWMELRNKPFYSRQEFLDSKVSKLQDHQLQIIYEETPYPHLSIRIRQKVYNFGLRQMIPYGLRTYVNRIHEKQTWLPHSQVWFTLNFTEKEILQMQAYLESKRKMIYKNIPGVNDCASMVARVLRKFSDIDIPIYIDPSPNKMAHFFSNLYTFGDSRVENIFQVAPMGSSKGFHTFKHVYISLVEAKIFDQFLPYTMGRRIWLDMNNDEEQLTYLNDELKRDLEKYKQGHLNDLQIDPIVFVAMDLFRKEARGTLSEEEQQKLPYVKEMFQEKLAQWQEQAQTTLKPGIVERENHFNRLKAIWTLEFIADLQEIIKTGVF